MTRCTMDQVVMIVFTGFLLLFFAFKSTEMAHVAVIEIHRGTNMSLFKLFDMAGVKCGDVGSSHVIRTPDADQTLGSDCVDQVVLLFDGGNFYIDLNITSATANIRTWFSHKPNTYTEFGNSIGTEKFDIEKNNFDFIFYRADYTEVIAAVYFPSDPNEVKPRFFYRPSGTIVHNINGPADGYDFSAMVEATSITLLFMTGNSCPVLGGNKNFSTCDEALADYNMHIEELCPCTCEYRAKLDYWTTYQENRTQENIIEEAKKQAEIIKKELTRNATELSSFKNKKISAADSRKSAQSLGLLGACTLGFVLAALVLCDIVSMKKHCKRCKRK